MKCPAIPFSAASPALENFSLVSCRPLPEITLTAHSELFGSVHLLNVPKVKTVNAP